MAANHNTALPQKEIVTESFTVIDMTPVTGVVLFCSESKGSGFHANERP